MRFYLSLLFLLLSVQCLAQRPFSRELWLNESNTPVRVNAMVQAGDDRILLGTENGLYHFSGRQFVNVPDSLHKAVSSLSFSFGNVWVGYQDGNIGKLEANTVSLMTLYGDKPGSAITAIHQLGANHILFATESQGIFIASHGCTINLDTRNGLSDNFVYDCVPAGKNEWLAVTDQGINIIAIRGNQLSVNILTTSDGLPDNIVRVVRPLGQTGIWVLGTQDGGLSFYDHKTNKIINNDTGAGWLWGQINDILVAGEEQMYVATEGGTLVAVQRNGNTLTYHPFDFSGKKLKKLLQDKAGNIWCATNQGLIMITASLAALISPGEPYSLKKLTALTCSNKNELWYALEDAVWKIPLGKDAGAVFAFKAPAEINTMYGDKDGNLWLGTLGKGLWCRNRKGHLFGVSAFENTNNAQILEITGRKDKIWISSLNGVEEFLRKDDTLTRIKRHNKSTGLGSDYVYQVLADQNGNTWFATDGAGISMYDGNKYHHWNESSGFNSDVVYSVIQDGMGNIWAGTLDHGLYRYDGKKWTVMHREDGLQDETISGIVANATGQVIIASTKGIDEWTATNRQFRHYNRRLGVDIDSTSQVLNCLTKDQEGNVYVPFEHGFIQFKNQHQKYDISPSVIITSTSLFLKQISNDVKRFSAGENYLTFRYEGINFSNPERLFFRYRLEGYNDDWISTSDESVTFPQLSPGKYRFVVQASLNRAFNDVSEASRTFTIALPWYRQPAFLLVAFIIIVGLIYLYTRIREQGLRKITQLQRERMVFEYEHLKSQVNPHFLFNSLNTLANLIEEDQDAAVDYTVQLSDLYRNALAYRDRDLIKLSEEWYLLEKYFYIQKSRFGDALQWQVDIPAEVMKQKQVVPLALQLLVENAIKHNVVSASSPLMITIVANEDEITISNPVKPKLSKEKGAGLGIENIKKRYMLLTKKTVTFGIIDNKYIVKLPLL